MSELPGALEAGLDAIVETATPAESWKALQPVLADGNGEFVLAIVPDMRHDFVAEAERARPGSARAQITPNMPDEARRDVALRLRARSVDILFVTPERFTEQKFVQFMRELAPRLLVVVSAQRGCGDEFDYCPSYDILRTLRGLFPEASVIALVDSPGTQAIRRAVTAGFGLRIAPKETATRNPGPRSEMPNPKGPPQAAREVDGGDVRPPKDQAEWARTVPLFEQGKTLIEVAEILGEDPDWCIEAVVHFIRQTGRTNPFPWVDKPSYLAVAMVAGQAESNDPRVLASILGDSVPLSTARIVVAALQNRTPATPGGGA